MNDCRLAALLPMAASRVESALQLTTRAATTKRDSASIATVWIEGVLTPWYLERVRQELYAILLADQVQQVILRMNTPGGFLAGTPETADLVRKLSESKHLTVVADEYLASGGYWIASQATRIVASPSTLIGSVGVISVQVDESAMFEAAGIRVIPVASSEAKSRGVRGTEITEADIEAVRSQIDQTTRWFLSYINRVPPRRTHRRMTADQTLAALDAEVYYAADAKSRGYIDEVLAPEEAVARIWQTDPYRNVRGADAYAELVKLAATERPADSIQYACDIDDEHLQSIRHRFPSLAAAFDDHQRLR